MWVSRPSAGCAIEGSWAAKRSSAGNACYVGPTSRSLPGRVREIVARASAVYSERYPAPALRPATGLQSFLWKAIMTMPHAECLREVEDLRSSLASPIPGTVRDSCILLLAYQGLYASMIAEVSAHSISVVEYALVRHLRARRARLTRAASIDGQPRGTDRHLGHLSIHTGHRDTRLVRIPKQPVAAAASTIRQ